MRHNNLVAPQHQDRWLSLGNYYRWGERRRYVEMIGRYSDRFEAIEPELIRFPSLNRDLLRSRVEQFIKHSEDKPEENQ